MKKLMLLLFKFLKILYPAHKLNIPSLLPFYRFIYKIVKPKGLILIESYGNKMYLNAQDEGVAPFLFFGGGVFEKYVAELFKKLVKPGMVVVDIGANIGYYTLIAAKLLEKDGRVYAFEPEPNNYKLLIKNIEINGYTNITPIQKAVSNKLGKTKLFVNKLNLAAHSLSEDNIYFGKAGFVEVETISLDDFFGNVVKDNKIDVIKMDVEGAEGLIIEGAEKILRYNNLKIFMEFWPYGLKNIGTDPLTLLHNLKNYGFKIKLIDGKNQYVSHVEINKLIKLSEKAKDTYYNLLLEK